MDWERLLVNILVTAGVPTAVYLIGAGAGCLHQKLKKLKAEAEASRSQLAGIAFGAADKVLEAVTRAAVGKLESTTAAQLREKVKAGESEFAELAALSKEALDEIVRQLKPDIRAALTEVVGDLNAYILNRIETALPQVKAGYADARAAQAIAEREMERAERETAGLMPLWAPLEDGTGEVAGT